MTPTARDRTRERAPDPGARAALARQTLARVALSLYCRKNAYSGAACMPTVPRSPDDLLPLRPVEALVLTMLSAGERHGYGIRQDILEHTQGRIELEAGSLYRQIRRLEAEGLVEP